MISLLSFAGVALEKGSFAASPADFSVRQYTQYEVTQASLLWAMAATLDLHREVALPVPLHKGLAPSVLPSASAFTYAVFAKFPTRNFGKK